MDSAIALFVYGTLKKGGRNHHLISECRFLGNGRTQPWYRMVHCGNYPGIVIDFANGRVIEGELFRVTPDQLAELDAFEGVPHLFSRGKVAIDPSVEYEVHAYFYERDISAFPTMHNAWSCSSRSVEIDQFA